MPQASIPLIVCAFHLVEERKSCVLSEYPDLLDQTFIILFSIMRVKDGYLFGKA